MTDLGRDVSDDEKRLKAAVSTWLDGKDASRTVPVVQIGQQHTGLHPQRIRQIVRTWENDGLAAAMRGANHMVLTTEGREHFGVE